MSFAATSLPRHPGRSSTPPEPAPDAVFIEEIVHDPFDLLIHRLSNRQFRHVLTYLSETPAHLKPMGRFVEAARLALQAQVKEYLTPGDCSGRPGGAGIIIWRRQTPDGRQSTTVLLKMRRLLAVYRACDKLNTGDSPKGTGPRGVAQCAGHSAKGAGACLPQC